jgi:4'-phosphopantetheinyl transferase EntD
MRFAIKEAIYKALAPKLRRYIGFEEAIVEPCTDGSAEVQLLLKEGGQMPDLVAEYTWVPQGLIATARARWP